jgi:hypothetical protein
VYNASDLYKRAISQPYRDLRLRCTIDNIVYTESDLQDCSIEESILTGEDFKFGSATASRLELTLLNMDDRLTAKSFEDKEVHIEIGVMLDKFHQPFEYVSMGFFIVEEARKDNNLIKLTGYDKMIYFEKPYVSNLAYPATLLQILQEICTQAGVQLENTSFLNSDYLVNEMPDLENVTLRLAVEHISELVCSFACINRAGKLELKTFSDTNVSINADNYYSMKLSEYEYGPIEVISINPENIFALNATQQLKDNMLNEVKGFTFKPFTTSWQGNPLTAPGDIINVSEKNGVKYKSFIANQKFNFSTGLKCDITTNAKTAIQSEFQTKGPISASIEKAKAELRSKIEQSESKILLEVEEVGKSVASLQLEADNINLKVEELDSSIAEIDIKADNISLRVEEVNSSIAVVDLKADNISLSVQSLDEEVGSVQSTLSVQAGQISTKVERDGVISAIIQSPETIKFSASKIELDGITQVNGNVELGKGWEPGGENGEKSITFSNAGKISYNDGFRYQASTFGHLFVGDVTIQSDYRLNLTGVQVIGLNVVASFG